MCVSGFNWNFYLRSNCIWTKKCQLMMVWITFIKLVKITMNYMQFNTQKYTVTQLQHQIQILTLQKMANSQLFYAQSLENVQFQSYFHLRVPVCIQKSNLKCFIYLRPFTYMQNKQITWRIYKTLWPQSRLYKPLSKWFHIISQILRATSFCFCLLARIVELWTWANHFSIVNILKWSQTELSVRFTPILFNDFLSSHMTYKKAHEHTHTSILMLNASWL